jgi:hypothetical protein
MSSRPTWDTWPCLHACTQFFRVAADAVEHLVPPPLVLKRDRAGRAEIELGYVRFRDGVHGLPPTEEIAWAIAVERVRGFGFAFFAMNIGADNLGFLDYNRKIGFNVAPRPLRFRADVERQTYRVEDEHGALICALRHQPEGAIPVPVFPVSTEVWTRTPDGRVSPGGPPPTNGLERRLMKWRGMARVHLAPLVASTLTDHPFFGGAKLTRAEPIPSIVFSSIAADPFAAQLFSAPEPHREDTRSETGWSSSWFRGGGAHDRGSTPR